MHGEGADDELMKMHLCADKGTANGWWQRSGASMDWPLCWPAVCTNSQLLLLHLKASMPCPSGLIWPQGQRGMLRAWCDAMCCCAATSACRQQPAPKYCRQRCAYDAAHDTSGEEPALQHMLCARPLALHHPPSRQQKQQTISPTPHAFATGTHTSHANMTHSLPIAPA